MLDAGGSLAEHAGPGRLAHRAHCVQFVDAVTFPATHRSAGTRAATSNNAVGIRLPRRSAPNRIVLGTDGIGDDGHRLEEYAPSAYAPPARERPDDASNVTPGLAVRLINSWDLFPEARSDEDDLEL